MRVCVVGAGVFGSCIAAGLMRGGHDVVLVGRRGDQLRRASSDFHRLIRLPYGGLPGYARMVRDAFPAWQRLWEFLRHSAYVESGTLISGHEGSSWIRDSVASMQSREYRRLSSSEVAGFVPGFQLRAGHVAYLVRQGGILLADQILAALDKALDDVERVWDSVQDIDASGRVHLASGATVDAARTIVAVGAWPWPGSNVQVHRSPSRQTALYLTPPGPEWDEAPFILDLSPTSGFYFVPPAAGTPAKLGTHTFSMLGRVDDQRATSEAELAELLSLRQKRAPFLRDWPVHSARRCYYDVTPDERFLAVFQGTTLFLGGFSGHGFKFAPLVAERVVEVLQGAVRPEAFKAWLAGVSP